MAAHSTNGYPLTGLLVCEKDWKPDAAIPPALARDLLADVQLAKVHSSCGDPQCLVRWQALCRLEATLERDERRAG